MAEFIFPPNPNTGQTVTGPYGEIYTWDGGRWTLTSGGGGGGGGGGANVSIGSTPPIGPLPGDLWWDDVGGQLYIYYNDGTSSQWVVTVNAVGLGGPFLPLAGGTLTGAVDSTFGPGIGLNMPNCSISIGGTVNATLFNGTNITLTGQISGASAISSGPITVTGGVSFTTNLFGPASWSIFNNNGQWIIFSTSYGMAPATNNALSCGISTQAWFQVYSYAFPQASASSFKRDIEPLKPGLEMVELIQPVQFKWDNGPDQENEHLGFIAEEVNKVLGEGTAPGAEAINTNELVAVLWRAVQQLSQRVVALEG